MDSLPVIRWEIITPRYEMSGNYERGIIGWRAVGFVTAPDAIAALKVARKHYGPTADVRQAESPATVRERF
jgi:hypothetical protein